MKRSMTLLLPVLLVLASCGTTAQYSQQRFPDSIYTKPGEEPVVVRLYNEEDFENMAAADIARKQGRDTLVVILDDPWDYAWYNRYNYYYYRSPWYWGGIGLGFSSYYWSRYYGGWYDPFYYSYYAPWYYYDPWYGYGYYNRWYDPWYGGYGWYGHRYGWYDHPYYAGGYWGGGTYRGSNLVYTPRNTTTVGGSRERRPGSGTNYRYGTPGSGGSSVIRGGSNTRPARSQSSLSNSGGSSSSSTVRTREQGYNPSRSYANKYSKSGSNTSSSSSSSTRSYSSSSNSSSTRSYSSGSSSSGSSSSSAGRSYSGGGGGSSSSHSSGSSSHSGGGGGGHSGGRR